MAETSRSDDHHFCPGIEVGCRLLDSVIGRQAGIRQSSDIFGVQAGIQFDDRACTGLEQVGHPPVHRDARESLVGAVHIIACPARATETTGDQRVHDHGISHRDIADR